MSRLTPETLRAYLDDTLSGAERSAAEEQLSQCASSRRLLVQQHQERLERAASSRRPDTTVPDELLETARAIGRRQGRRQQQRWVGPLAAAALVVLAVGGWQLDVWGPTTPNGSPNGVPSTDTLRSDRTGQTLTGNALITALGPKDGTVIGEDGVTLRWSVEGQVRETNLTLVDGLGNPLWQGPVEGSSWTLDPQSLPPRPAGSLYWFVTVRLDDGTTAETELRELSTSDHDVGMHDPPRPLP